MIDRKAIASGIAEMKAYLVDADERGVISFLGKHVSGGVETVPDEIELEGSLNLVTLANAFMNGAGIHPLKDVVQLQEEVETMRREIDELKRFKTALTGTPIVPAPSELSPQRQALRDSFRPLSEKVTPVTPPLGGPVRTKE